MTRASINSFLLFGYFLDYYNPDIRFDFSGIDKTAYADVPYEELRAMAAGLYRRAVTSQFQPGALHFLPLSGGLDSRAILALLRECTEAENIHTYTYGTPGTMDYDIGCALAKKIGTRHAAMDLRAHRYTQEELLDASRRMKKQIMLFTHPPLADWDARFRGGVLWSGFIGGRTSGSYLPRPASGTFAEAAQRYVKHNLLGSTYAVTPEDTASVLELLDTDDGGSGGISIDERLDLLNRQVKYTIINNVMEGFDYRLPFAYKPLFDFLFSLPDKYRLNQKLYIDVFSHYYPDIFNYPSKTTVGLPVTAPPWLITWKTRMLNMRYHVPGFHYLIKNPFINYFDIAKRIRTDREFQRLLRDNLDDLKNAGLSTGSTSMPSGNSTCRSTRTTVTFCSHSHLLRYTSKRAGPADTTGPAVCSLQAAVSL